MRSNKPLIKINITNHNYGNYIIECIESIINQEFDDFTLDKPSAVIREHALSASPDEFKNMTQIGRDIVSKVSIGI